MKRFYQFSAQTISGQPFEFSNLQNKVVLVVNTASRCGYTGQYAGLEMLYKEFRDRGLEILAFPCNQFAAQESGSNEQIASFCDLNYHISFPLFAKIEVNGNKAHPLYQWLKKEKSGFLGLQRIPWNFTKFLINRQGEVVARYGPKTKPEELKESIQELL